MGTVRVSIIEFTNYAQSVAEALDAVGARDTLAGQTRIVLKPNIINASPPPITTPVQCVEAVLDYCRANSDAEVVVGS